MKTTRLFILVLICGLTAGHSTRALAQQTQAPTSPAPAAATSSKAAPGADAKESPKKFDPDAYTPTHGSDDSTPGLAWGVVAILALAGVSTLYKKLKARKKA